MFAPPKESSQSVSNAGAVSERKIVDSFSRIANRCRNTPIDPDGDANVEGCLNDLDVDVVDEVGYQMILGVTERYWRWTGALWLQTPLTFRVQGPGFHVSRLFIVIFFFRQLHFQVPSEWVFQST
jgi:hypothetical protein